MALNLRPRFGIIDPCAVDRRHDCTRSHSVYPHAASGVLESEGFRQVLHAALANRIREVLWLGDDFIDARVVENDAALSAHEKVPNGLARAEERPLQVHVQHPIEVLELNFVAGRRLLDSGVIDKNVDHPVKHLLHLVLFGDIRLNHKILSARLPGGHAGLADHDLRSRSLLRTTAVVDSDVGPLLREPAIACPIPEEAPVISTFFASRLSIVLPSFCILQTEEPAAPCRYSPGRQGRADSALIVDCDSADQPKVKPNCLTALRIVIAAATVCALNPLLRGAVQPWFEPNSGQMPGSIRFLARVAGHTLAFNEDGSTTYVLNSAPETADVVHMKLLGARPLPDLSGEGALPSFSRYYGGEQGATAEARHYSGVTYHDIYPGTDFLWHARRDGLEYEFQLAAGADSKVLQIHFDGQENIALDHDGDLIVTTLSGNLRYRHPQGWQEIEGRRVAIAVEFRIESGIVSFDVGPYDSKLPLRIDPVLEFSSYVGGSGFDAAYAIARDSAGNIYTSGETASFDFPSAGGGAGVRSTRAAFITKLSADGSRVLFTTVLASTGGDCGRGLALDSTGNIWVTGTTGSSGFPTTSNALSRSFNGGQDVFVARLDPAGRLAYATYLGGTGTDVGMGIALDASGVYVAGYTGSTNFPTTAGAPQTTFQGGYYDAFVLKLDPTATALLYSTYLAGTGNDTAAAIAVNVKGDACIAGRTDSASLPLRNALQSSYSGNGDILLGCLNPTGTAWNLLTYLGGSAADEANAIALDPSGNIYLTGDTLSRNFPASPGAYQSVSGGGYDAFAVKLNPTATAIVFASLVGGSGNDLGTAISIGTSGTVWIAGYTGSADFPATATTTFAGYFDGFVAEFNPAGASLLFASYLSGSSDDRCQSIVLSAEGDPIVAGMTGSTDFPATVGAAQATHPTPYNAFVSKLKLPRPVVASVSPSTGSGMKSTFSFVYSDAAGARDLAMVQVLMNGVFSGAPACYATVDPARRMVWLFNDGGTVLLGPVTMGAAGTMQNSQCAVDGAGSGIALSGDQLTLTLAVTFSTGFWGAKTVYGYAQTANGLNSGWTTLGTWTVLDVPPQAVSVTPSSGTGSANTFSFLYSDSNGASGLGIVQIVINSSLSGYRGCYLNIDPVSKSLSLLNDDATAWQGPITLPGTSTLKNSQCTLNAGSSGIAVSGDNTTINLALSFSTAFGGPKSVYAYAQALNGLNSGWVPIGNWTVLTVPPQAVSVTPSAGTGTTNTFSFLYFDANGASDLGIVQFVINSSLSGYRACYVNVDFARKSLWLLSDDATTWQGPITVPGTGALQNSQCTVIGGSSSVGVSGNNTTLNLALGFSHGFAGLKTVYGYAQAVNGLNSGWTTLGNWTVP